VTKERRDRRKGNKGKGRYLGLEQATVGVVKRKKVMREERERGGVL
jgi:hypothetical protein